MLVLKPRWLERVDVDRVREHADRERAEQRDHHAALDVAAHLAGDVGRVLEADELQEHDPEHEREHRRREQVTEEVVCVPGQDRVSRRGDLRRGDAVRVLRQVVLEVGAAGGEQAEHEHQHEGDDAERRQRGHHPVEAPGRQQHDPGDDRQHDERADEARRAGDRAGRVGEPGVRVLEEVAARADADDAAVIWRLRSTSGTSNAMIRTEAITSVHDSIQPRNGPMMRLVNT